MPSLNKEYHRRLIARCALKARTKLKRELVNSKGGCCEMCGYNKSIRGLCFHHTDPSQKDFSLSRKRGTLKQLDFYLSEVQKCTLLCLNCHAEIHEEWDRQLDMKRQEEFERLRIQLGIK